MKNKNEKSLKSLELSTAVNLALEKGSEPAMGNKIDNVVVILNPMANGGFAVQAYEENAKLDTLEKTLLTYCFYYIVWVV